MGCPPCITMGAGHKHSNTCEPGMAGTEERRTPDQDWRGTNIRTAICQGWQGLNDDVQDGQPACGAQVKDTLLL